MNLDELTTRREQLQNELADVEKQILRIVGDPARDILMFLNEKAHRKYRPTVANLRLIRARLAEGFSPDEMRQVVAKKCREWQADQTMRTYLRPATLFNATKFSQYSGELL